jgi:hypothetical protein
VRPTFYVIFEAVIDHFCSSNSKTNTSTINPQYLSKSGAFNGTGLAIASYSFGTGGYGVINVYFQHWTGQIRKLELLNDGSWAGGDASSIVATDAKNGTPISAVAYAMDGIATVSQFPQIHHRLLLQDLVAHILHRHEQYHSPENQRQQNESVDRRPGWQPKSCRHG